MQKHLSYYKQIDLKPTDFTLDVVVGKRIVDVANTASEKIGKSVKFWKKWIGKDQNCMIHARVNGSQRMVIFLKGFDPAIIAHEATHVTWHLDSLVNFRYSYDSHELQCYLIENIVKEILNLQKCTAKETKSNT